MKNILRIVALFACYPAACLAQGSITLYGVADIGAVYLNNSNGASLVSMNSGNIMGSRVGIRGTEDLGDGLAANFVLENGFNVDTGKLGQGNNFFGRQSYVGLTSRETGSVTFGRQYDSVVDFVGGFESGTQWATSYGAHPGDLDNMNNTNRVNNSVKVTSKSYGGLTVGALYGFGETAGQSGKNQIWSLGAKYVFGQLALGAAFLSVNNPNYAFFGNNPASSTAASNLTGSRIYSGYASAGQEQIVALGTSYNSDRSTYGATYSNSAYKNLGSANVGTPTPLNGSARFHNAELNYKYQLTPALVGGLAYDHTIGYGVNHARYRQLAAGLDYFFSKQTDIYLVGIYQQASGTDSTGAASVAHINLLTASSTNRQFALVAGMRLKF